MPPASRRSAPCRAAPRARPRTKDVESEKCYSARLSLNDMEGNASLHVGATCALPLRARALALPSRARERVSPRKLSVPSLPLPLPTASRRAARDHSRAISHSRLRFAIPSSGLARSTRGGPPLRYHDDECDGEKRRSFNAFNIYDD